GYGSAHSHRLRFAAPKEGPHKSGRGSDDLSGAGSLPATVWPEVRACIHGGVCMRLAVIPGDGIGPEVIAEALKVLGEVVPAAEITRYDLGAARWHATGELLPESVLGELREHDAILLGAVGDPSVPSGILERGLLLRLRFELDHHVNLRPARLYPGVRGPLSDQSEIDMVLVREGTEGPYAGNGGLLRKDPPTEIATEVSVNTGY